MTYKCFIVDDERPALKLLTAYIERLPHLELMGAFEDALTALAALQKNTVDLMFLDIQMPGFTGLELLNVIQNPPKVVFTTAYRDYAVEGFSHGVTDYLVKPFSFERFVQAVNKAIELIKLEQQNSSTSSPSINSEEEPRTDHFFVRTNHKMEKVAIKDILYVESMREYVGIHTKERRYMVNMSMNKMEEELPNDQFMRVHRSYLISFQHIDSIMGNTIYIGEQKIPVGATYRKKFFEQIKLL